MDIKERQAMSIEERAIEWATNKPQSHGRLQGYIKGATEQREIDIDKAIDVIENLPQDFSRQMIIDALIEAIEG